MTVAKPVRHTRVVMFARADPNDHYRAHTMVYLLIARAKVTEHQFRYLMARSMATKLLLRRLMA